MENNLPENISSHPLVSIITPSFNRGDVIAETAESIFRQTYPYWQWVIVDDGSTDNSIELLTRLAANESRIKLLQRNRLPKGACTCRNMAVENADGEYLVFLDSDDLIARFCLEQRVQEITGHPATDFIIFPMLMFKKKPDDLGLLWNTDNGRDELERILRNDPVCQGTGTIWRRTSFQKIGMWREDLEVWQDIELHIRSLLWPLSYEKRMHLRPDTFIRISETSLSRTGFDSTGKLSSRICVFEYAIKKINEAKLLQTYKEALKQMAWDITVSAINSNHFLLAKKMIAICETTGMFTAAAQRDFRNYMIMRKLKGYKIPAVNSFFYSRLKKNKPAGESNVAKKPYNGKITF